MFVFIREIVFRIMRYFDFLNVMIYDLMNCCDIVMKYYIGIDFSFEVFDVYIVVGVVFQEFNLGFVFYVKYFCILYEKCLDDLIGCFIVFFEDLLIGVDFGQVGVFLWYDVVFEDVVNFFIRVIGKGRYDEKQGGYYYWDEEEDIWWIFDMVEVIKRKFLVFVDKKRFGGVFVWGLGEDVFVYECLVVVNEELDK